MSIPKVARTRVGDERRPLDRDPEPKTLSHSTGHCRTHVGGEQRAQHAADGAGQVQRAEGAAARRGRVVVRDQRLPRRDHQREADAVDRPQRRAGLGKRGLGSGLRLGLGSGFGSEGVAVGPSHGFTLLLYIICKDNW